MLTTSSGHPQVTQKSDTIQISLLPLTHEISPIELTTGKYTVGTSPECPIRIEVPGVAAEHCTIVVGHNDVSIHAIDPRVWVNDRPVRQSNLIQGTKFFIGPVGILVDSVIELKAESTTEQIQPGPVFDSKNQIEIPKELQSIADVQKVLAERQSLLEKIKAEQAELQREMQLQEAELAKLNHRFQLDPKNNTARDLDQIKLQESHRIQQQFDDSILESDHKLRQFKLLKQEIAEDQQNLLTHQNQVTAQRQHLIQFESSLKQEQETLNQQQKSLLQDRLDLEDQRAHAQTEQDTERAFVEKLKAEQQELQAAVALTEQSALHFEQGLNTEQNRLEAWAEDLEKLQRDLEEQQAQLNLESDELKAMRDQLVEQQDQLQIQREEVAHQHQDVQNLQADFDLKKSTWDELQEQHSQKQAEFTNQQNTLDQRQSDLESKWADLETERATFEAQRDLITQDQVEQKKNRESIEQDQNEIQERTNEVEEQAKQIQCQQQLLEERELTVTEREVQLTSLEVELKEQQSAIQEQQTDKVIIDEQNDQLRTELEANQGQLDEVRVRQEQFQSELELQQQQLEEREQAIVDREVQLASLEEELTEQQSAFQVQQSDKVGHEEQNDQLRAELETNQGQLDEVRVRQEQFQSELELQQQQLEEREQSITEREAHLTTREQELDTTRSEQTAAAADREALSEQQKALELLRSDLEQQQEELKAQEEQLQQQEQERSEQKQTETDHQIALDELNEEKENLSQSHNQLQIDRAEISRQRDSLESLQLQLQKDHGELEDREKIIQIREQQSAEQEQLLADVGLNVEQSDPQEQDDSCIEEMTSSRDQETVTTLDNTEAASQQSGSLLESFLNDSNGETPEPISEQIANTETETNSSSEQLSHELPEDDSLSAVNSPLEDPELDGVPTIDNSQAKSGSLLDLFTQEEAPETVDTENELEEIEVSEAETTETEVSKNQSETPALDDAEDPDSIAAYMKGLLERSRSGSLETTATASPTTHQESDRANDSTLSTNSMPESQLENENLPMDEKLETLKKAPTHSQDKDAVRDAMNSFRDVANYSARMAIAQHSMKNQRMDFLFKGILTGVCVLTTIIMFSESIWGGVDLGIMKWAALAVSLASITQFLRTYNETHKLFPSKKTLESHKESDPDDNIADDDQDSQLESLDEEILSEAADSLEDPEQLLTDEEELQSLEAQLLLSAHAKQNRSALMSDEDNQLETPDFEMDADK